MTPEFYAIIATGIALAGLILNNQGATAKSIAEMRRDLNALGERVDRDTTELREQTQNGLAELREQTHQGFAELREQMHRDIAALGERIARLEGFMEGIRDAIAGKAA